jgi:hypothetical protein
MSRPKSAELPELLRLSPPVLGHPCWGVHFCNQLNLSLNFGKPKLRIREPLATRSKLDSIRRLAANRNVTLRGQWWLWLFCCWWRLSRDGELLATGSSSLRRIDKALIDLAGQKLTGVHVHSQTGATHFAFDLGCQLDCRRYDAVTDAALWYLYFPTGRVLAVHGDGTYKFQMGSAHDPARRPLPDGRLPF